MKLEDYIKKNIATHERKVGLGNAFQHFIFADTANRIDNNLIVNGIDKVLYDSEFTKLIDRLGYNLARDGQGWGLEAFEVDGSLVIDIARIFDYRKKAGKLMEIWIDTEITYQHGKVVVPVFSHYKLEGGFVIKDQGMFLNNEWVLDKSYNPIILETNVIPAWPFEFQSSCEGVIPHALYEAIETMNFFSNELPKEWEKTKTMFLHNAAFETNITGEQRGQAIRNGSDVIEVTDPNANLGGAFSAFSSGSTTPDILDAQIMFLENRILKYSFLSTDTNWGKQAQQTTGEVSKLDRQALEHLIKINKIRLADYKRFFDAISAWTGIEITVDLPLPAIDQYTLDNLELDLEVKRGQATSQMAKAQAPATEEVPVEGE